MNTSPAHTPEDFYRAFVAEIKAEMARQNMNGRTLHELTGISESTISRRLSGAGKSLDALQVVYICHALGINLYELVRRTEEMLHHGLDA